MRTTRRTALLSALGIGIAAKLPVVDHPMTPVLTNPGNRLILESTGPRNAISASAGWCAPSHTLYDLGPDWNEIFIQVPEIKVKRGGIRYG